MSDGDVFFRASSQSRQAGSGWLALVVLTLALASGRAAEPAASGEQVVTIGTLHGKMRFDVELFQTRPGAKVRLTLKNTDEMQHNLLILARGQNKVLQVAQKAWALGTEAVKKDFVPDSPDVLFHTKVLNPQQSDTITFVAPQQEGDYPYVCTLPGHAFSMKGIMRVSQAGEAKAVAAVVDKESTSNRLHVHVMDEPKVIRAFVDGGPARSISVGLPGGLNYLFDAEQAYVRFGWFGMFLDVGPNVGRDAGDRGGGWCKILGDKFELGDAGFPLSLGKPDVKHTVKFAGYRQHGKEVPSFFFTIDGKRVTQTIRPAAKGLGFQYDFEFEREPGKVFYYVSPHNLKLSSSAGEWNAGRLEVPASESRKFSVTIVRQP